MAKIFWAWRVLSAYVLLITVTIYAATDSEFGRDALDNEAGETRYDQTFKHPTGLLIFIYSWLATPLWQWVGAIVIFDYKNLGSVGRDVDTLVEDNKWNQVLELVSFGAAFNHVKVLQKIEQYKAKARQIQSHQSTELSHDHANTRIQILPRQGNECDKGHVLVYKNNGYGGLFTCNQCGGHISQSMSWHCDTCDYDLCRDCYSFHNGTKEEDDGPNCPKKHGLTEFEPESDGVRCDICGQKKRKGDMMHGCRECDYDVCAGCKEGVVRLARCDKGHILKHK
eukprot:209513_1